MHIKHIIFTGRGTAKFSLASWNMTTTWFFLAFCIFSLMRHCFLAQVFHIQNSYSSTDESLEINSWPNAGQEMNCILNQDIRCCADKTPIHCCRLLHMNITLVKEKCMNNAQVFKFHGYPPPQHRIQSYDSFEYFCYIKILWQIYSGL